MVMSDIDGVRLFRNSAPYINSHRGKTFVLMFGGEAVEDVNFPNIINDIALLNSLGVKLVLVHGARPQIDQRIALRGVEKRFNNNIRLTDKQTLESVKDAAGSVRSQIEALLTMGLANSPMHGAHIRVCSGNLVVAMPMGVREGVDFEHTGVVRRIDVMGINDHLQDGSIVLLSPMGYSSTGEVFNLSHEDVATQAAISLNADKLIVFSEHQGILDETGKLRRNIDSAQLSDLLEEGAREDQLGILDAINQTIAADIPRCHCVSYKKDGALLQELFTRDGSGSLVSKRHYEQLRKARIEDVGGILQLINPLEEKGILVKRSRELLEAEIEQFTVIERDGMIIACAAFYPYPQDGTGELACVATHGDYRGKSRAERLLEAIRQDAIEQGLESIFVLTTVTAHWFQEQGFVLASIDALPESKKLLYNFQRNSKVFVMALDK
ncbi:MULTISPECIES: amino-acid N-acetyltransferase [Alteromonadaceae]|uniref:amino-acid N-acetyltransferase n=1 Tax=Alteromonadaceae TaxID=72275 RepID=UPI001C0A0B1F|nr:MULTISPECIES: amino-acid N-acetyltransferase [Aliiglaciecola]MBU2878523.1 amino-acid N-acetyltransferase [Aliiglaciecola lipolytica]MDO6709649.1 amino-acid N-acetyltransferase [Aliiglaciecola sp. 2_MG-2023]MDO6750809.1 amino-acid N-acetyltransferase [Aliiglaciecola sp. 1_MG-2023]